MKWFPILAFSACLGAALAAAAAEGSPVPPVPSDVQSLPEPQFDAWVQSERDQIAQEKAAAEQRYHEAEFACWKRFAVNDCLRRSRRQRRSEINAARKTELAVNAAERDYKTRERLQEIAGKQKK